MQRTIISLLLLAMAAPAWGQSVTLPDEIRTTPGAWTIVAPSKIDGGQPRWRIDPALQEVDLGLLLPEEYVAKLKGKIVTVVRDQDGKLPLSPITNLRGLYRVEAWNAKGDVPSEIAVCFIRVGEPAPDPKPPGPDPPKPDPKPPEPKPPEVPDELGFVALSRAEALKVPAAQRGMARGLADNFEAVSAKLAATAGMTIDQANADLRTRNGETVGAARESWLPWFTAWKARSDALNSSGKLATKDDYVKAYRETAAGLRQVQ